MFARGGEDGWRSGESCGWGYGLGLQSHVVMPARFQHLTLKMPEKARSLVSFLCNKSTEYLSNTNWQARAQNI